MVSRLLAVDLDWRRVKSCKTVAEEFVPDTRGRKRIHSTTVGRIERLHDPPTLIGLEHRTFMYSDGSRICFMNVPRRRALKELVKTKISPEPLR